MQALGDEVIKGRSMKYGLICKLFTEFFDVDVIIRKNYIFTIKDASFIILTYLHKRYSKLITIN
jgi:hypothetical protein